MARLKHKVGTLYAIGDSLKRLCKRHKLESITAGDAFIGFKKDENGKDTFWVTNFSFKSNGEARLFDEKDKLGG